MSELNHPFPNRAFKGLFVFHCFVQFTRNIVHACIKAMYILFFLDTCTTFNTVGERDYNNDACIAPY